jgi:hypothetical protein
VAAGADQFAGEDGAAVRGGFGVNTVERGAQRGAVNADQVHADSGATTRLGSRGPQNRAPEGLANRRLAP